MRSEGRYCDYFCVGDDDHDVRADLHSADDVPQGLRIPLWSWDGLVSGPEPDDS